LFLKMGQLLSIPFVILGVVLVVVALRRPEAEPLKAEKPSRAELRRQQKAK
jgi:prolipoprotein diacylglyceryltransferase